MTDALAAARAAHAHGDWPAARERFAASGELGPADLSALSDTEWWLGRFEESLTTLAAAFSGHERAGQTRQAAMVAMDLAGTHILRGAEALAVTWLNRAGRLLRDDPDCVESVYLRFMTEVEADPRAAASLARQVREEGRRHADPNLVALATMAEGRAVIKQGQVVEGFALIDESMAAVLADELLPQWAGYLYCNLIEACHEIADLHRMRMWTEALRQWCARFPVAVMFTGVCRVHQAQLLQVGGEWERSEAEAARVCFDLRAGNVESTAEAHYVVAEARRLRGDLAGAEQAYLAAHELGRDPQPGLALLRLAQDRAEVALRSIQTALTAEDGGLLRRFRLCSAAVDIGIAAGSVETARKAADELTEAASRYDSSGLRVLAAHARGAVLLAEGHPDEALPVLRKACAQWRRLEAPYDCARVRLLLARVYDLLGDEDASRRERSAAERTLTDLGLATPAPAPGGLTSREVDVLILVAAGKSNRAVAAELVLSEKTVGRHLANIFHKLNVSSRTAAAAYAFEHGLVARVDG